MPRAVPPTARSANAKLHLQGKTDPTDRRKDEERVALLARKVREALSSNGEDRAKVQVKIKTRSRPGQPTMARMRVEPK